MRPIDIPQPSRPARIAALHAAGVFLADHSDLPMPERIEMRAWTSVDRFMATAQQYDAKVNNQNGTTWIDIPVALETLHGIDITYVLFCEKAPETSPMQLPPRGLGVTTDPWADVIPPSRCTATWRQFEPSAPMDARCVLDQGHSNVHFFDDDKGHLCAGGQCIDPAAHAEGAHDL